jgi:DNA-binding LytR/AlgR family response regulator
VIIGIANWGYNYALTEDEEMQHDIFSFLFLTLAVGIFPIIFTTIYLEKYLSHKHQTIAHTLNNNIKISEKFPENQRITIITDNKNEILSMDLQDFLCVHSDGNYNEVFFLQERILQRKLIRATLGKIEKQLSVYPSIRRCHRSYLVNLDNVIEIQGNARNYSIILQDLEFPIPISRTFQKEILASIKLIKF